MKISGFIRKSPFVIMLLSLVISSKTIFKKEIIAIVNIKNKKDGGGNKLESWPTFS